MPRLFLITQVLDSLNSLFDSEDSDLLSNLSVLIISLRISLSCVFFLAYRIASNMHSFYTITLALWVAILQIAVAHPAALLAPNVRKTLFPLFLFFPIANTK